MQLRSLGQEEPLEKGRAAHASVHGQRDLAAAARGVMWTGAQLSITHVS